jgi:glutathione synthase/RimK-type ligase-like ATP-grasp enzyme
MSKYKKLASIGLAATGIFLIGGQAVASDVDRIAYDSEVKSCVVEIGDHANYENATRVRHTVLDVRRRLNGYILAIDTAVFTQSNEVATREYVTVCSARGDSKPFRFNISETGTGA